MQPETWEPRFMFRTTGRIRLGLILLSTTNDAVLGRDPYRLHRVPRFVFNGASLRTNQGEAPDHMLVAKTLRINPRRTYGLGSSYPAGRALSSPPRASLRHTRRPS